MTMKQVTTCKKQIWYYQVHKLFCKMEVSLTEVVVYAWLQLLTKKGRNFMFLLKATNT